MHIIVYKYISTYITLYVDKVVEMDIEGVDEQLEGVAQHLWGYVVGLDR